MSRMRPKVYRGQFVLVHKPACHTANAPDPDYEYTPSRIDRFITVYNQVLYNIILLATLAVLVVLLVKPVMLFPLWYCN